MKGARGSYIH